MKDASETITLRSVPFVPKRSTEELREAADRQTGKYVRELCECEAPRLDCPGSNRCAFCGLEINR